MKIRRLADILKERSSWSKKQCRKYKKKRQILKNKHYKRLTRSQHNTKVLDIVPKDSHYCENAGVICPYWYEISIPESELENHVGIVAVGQTCIGGCKLINKTDDDMEGWGLLWETVKECGLNLPGDGGF